MRGLCRVVSESGSDKASAGRIQKCMLGYAMQCKAAVLLSSLSLGLSLGLRMLRKDYSARLTVLGCFLFFSSYCFPSL